MSLFASLALSLLALASPAEPWGGVVVEEVQPGYAAHRAGLVAGDVLVSWERAPTPPANPEPARGELHSPFDLVWVEREESSRGQVSLRGTRGGAALSLPMPAAQ